MVLNELNTSASEIWWLGPPTGKKTTFGRGVTDIPEADPASDIVLQSPARVLEKLLCDVTHDEVLVSCHTQYTYIVTKIGFCGTSMDLDLCPSSSYNLPDVHPSHHHLILYCLALNDKQRQDLYLPAPYDFESTFSNVPNDAE